MDRQSILVVEDEVLIRMYLIDQIRKMGAEVVGYAESGEKAVELARALKPRMIFMDIRLAGPMDGIAAARIIVAEQESTVVFMSAYDYREKVKTDFPDRKIHFVPKPVRKEDLTKILENP